MNFFLADKFSEIFWNIRIEFCQQFILTDQLLGELVEAEIVNEEQRYQIFSSPLPTRFSNPRRIRTLLRIIEENWSHLEFIEFLKIQGPHYTELLLYIDTEISNCPPVWEFMELRSGNCNINLVRVAYQGGQNF